MNYSRGITFIEVLVSITVFTFAMLAIVSSVLYFYRTNTYVIEQASAVNAAQRGIEEMVKTMREISYASNGAYPVAAVGPQEVTFYADIDSDPLIERVRYYVQGISLLRDVTDPTGDPPVYGAAQTTSVISETVRNIEQATTTFQYYDMNGAEITNFAQIAYVRFITMNVIVNVDPNRLPNQLTLRSTAALRNLK
ncbi:MAG: hypothetical protein G01um10148_48 [Parcubacteria group bacterium Gr01-1014_8]|nr:MAG: hypothetical protein G01um10148_48 [Parcubacteria group bacterium Gr01-1014_8]